MVFIALGSCEDTIPVHCDFTVMEALHERQGLDALEYTSEVTCQSGVWLNPAGICVF
jgi:hypothetical protein